MVTVRVSGDPISMSCTSVRAVTVHSSNTGEQARVERPALRYIAAARRPLDDLKNHVRGKRFGC
jgi:hypothetical protein